jgi:hypothetical protein
MGILDTNSIELVVLGGYSRRKRSQALRSEKKKGRGLPNWFKTVKIYEKRPSTRIAGATQTLWKYIVVCVNSNTGGLHHH